MAQVADQECRTQFDTTLEADRLEALAHLAGQGQQLGLLAQVMAGDVVRGARLRQRKVFLQAVVGGMADGAVLLVDYGYARGEYYQPERRDGTLRAFRRHHLVEDVFAWPGLQDITASVDFTALVEAGVGAGFEFSGYCSQASFLIGNRLQDNLALAEARAQDDIARHNLRQQVKLLTLPGEMGERFQAIGFQRGVEFGAAFLVGDLSHRL